MPSSVRNPSWNAMKSRRSSARRPCRQRLGRSVAGGEGVPGRLGARPAIVGCCLLEAQVEGGAEKLAHPLRLAPSERRGRRPEPRPRVLAPVPHLGRGDLVHSRHEGLNAHSGAIRLLSETITAEYSIGSPPSTRSNAKAASGMDKFPLKSPYSFPEFGQTRRL